MSGLDKVGWSYTLQAITLAHDMRILDGSKKVKSNKEQRARDFTAWALFNSQWYVSSFELFLSQILLTAKPTLLRHVR